MTQNTFNTQTARFLSSVATCMPQLPGDVMQGWIDNPRALQKVLTEALAPSGKGISARKILRLDSRVSVGPLAKRFDPRKFLQDRADLFIRGDFERVVLLAAAPVETAEASLLLRSTLLKQANDRKIRSELAKSHLVELWQIAELIERQPNGAPGYLLNNGYANIFYVRGKNGEVFAVVVFRNPDHRRWTVNALSLNVVWWCVGNQVFSSD